MVNNNNAIMNGNCALAANQFAEEQQNVEKIAGVLDTLIDFAWFIIYSIGFILREFYHRLVGHPEKDLKDDIALVTGGGNGLGRKLAIRLGKLGLKVIIWDINQEGIKETINIIKDNGGFCKGYVVDISNKDEVYRAAKILQQEVGDVTLLINNAGVVSGLPLLDTPDHLIERSFNVNVMAHFWTTKAFLPKMIENDRGHITTIASLAGHVGISKLVDYCASKFAAVGFDEALRLELDVLGHKNIKTTCICPFFIQATGMFDDVNARWVPTLNPDYVADEIIAAIKRNQKIAILPGFLRFLLPLKWMFPWGCTAGLLRRLVPDAAPQVNNKTTTFIKKNTTSDSLSDIPTTILKDEKLMEDTEEALPKAASMLLHRTPSLGERVL